METKEFSELSFSQRRILVKLDQLLDSVDFIRVRMDAPKLDSFYDLSQVCSLLNVSKRTVQRLRSTNRIKYFVISGRTYYPKKETDQFIQHYRAGNISY